MRRVLLGVGAATALAVTVFVAFGGVALVNYDTLYTVIWGRDLARGVTPDLTVTLAPTAHPLQELLAMPLVLLFGDVIEYGDAAAWMVTGGAYFLLGVLGVLVFAVGRAWFGAAAGALAALIVLTREPVLSYGLRAYVDLPYLCLLLGAVLVETRRSRAGWPVLALLALAGLLRPEAWLMSGVYLLWLTWGGNGRRGYRLVGLICLVFTGPFLWVIHDFLITGNALWSLTGTRDNAATLRRTTGLSNIPTTVPRRLGEILREPVLLAAAGGTGLSWWRRRDDARLAMASGALTLLAFCVLAAAGLSILVRYLLPAATIGALFAGAGVFGWTALERGDPIRRWWIGFAAICVVTFAVFAPGQIDRLDRLQRALSAQEEIVADLRTFFDGSAPDRATCDPVVVPNRRPVPYVALWTGGQPGDVAVTADDAADPRNRAPSSPRARGTVLAPLSARVGRLFVFDPRDARSAATAVATPSHAKGSTIATRFWQANSSCLARRPR